MFLETAEKLNTINKIIALTFNDWSTALFFGLTFLLLLAIVLICKNKLLIASDKFNSRTILIVLIILCWSPLFFDNIASASWAVFRQSKLITASSDSKLQDRLCVVDDNQKLGNSVCLLMPFAKEVKNLVPPQAKVALSSGGFYSIFLQYYFIPDYQITSPKLADYWLLYLSDSDWQIDNNQDLIEIRGDVKTNWGRWQVVKIFNQGMLILKR